MSDIIVSCKNFIQALDEVDNYSGLWLLARLLRGVKSGDFDKLILKWKEALHRNEEDYDTHFSIVEAELLKQKREAEAEERQRQARERRLERDDAMER